MAAHVEGDSEKYFMGKAFEMAEFALRQKEVPVGCVVVLEGAVIARGCNEVNLTKNATRHAEMVAIDHLMTYCSATGKLLGRTCASASLLVTVEPCIMCAFALRTIGLLSVIFGCNNKRFGGCGSVLDVRKSCPESSLSPLNARASSCEDVASKALKLLQNFYELDNPNTV